jgi:hypothetical protein
MLRLQPETGAQKLSGLYHQEHSQSAYSLHCMGKELSIRGGVRNVRRKFAGARPQ